MAPHGRMIYPLLQRALVVWEALCAAPEAHLLAEVISPLATNATLAASHADLQGHAITKGKAAHMRADGDDHTRGLMAERQGLAGAKVAIGELLEVGDI